MILSIIINFREKRLAQNTANFGHVSKFQGVFAEKLIKLKFIKVIFKKICDSLRFICKHYMYQVIQFMTSLKPTKFIGQVCLISVFMADRLPHPSTVILYIH